MISHWLRKPVNTLLNANMSAWQTLAMGGEMDIPGALTAQQWGFHAVLFSKINKDQRLSLKASDRFPST